MRQYRGFDVGRIDSKVARQVLQGMDVYLRQVSRQLSVHDTSPTATAGNLSSIASNGGTKRTGDITFTNTPTIQVTNSGQDFTWDVASLPAVVFGAVQALGANTVLTDGVLLTASHSDHLHSIASAAHSGGYATAATTGAGNDFMRASAVLEFPSALMPSGTTKTLTLTDDATEGALLTALNTFSANAAAILAPNATNALRIGKYGNISLAGTALSDTTLAVYQKTDFNEAVNAPTSVGATITNTNSGSGSGSAIGVNMVVGATMLNAGAPSANPVQGMRITLSGGNTTNNNFVAPLRGAFIPAVTVTAQTIGTTIPDITGYQFAISPTLTRVLVTDIFGVRVGGGATLLTSAAVTNNTGFRCNALTAGTNRYGLDIAAFTTGTPTVSYGVQVATHSVGTTRRSFIGGNSIVCTANDFACDTAAKGFICKDAQGTAEYWRMYTSVSGATVKDATWTTDADGFASFTRAASATGSVILNVQDAGTALPTT